MTTMMHPADLEDLPVNTYEEIKKVRAELAEFRKEMRDTLRKFQIAMYNYADTSDPNYLLTYNREH